MNFRLVIVAQVQSHRGMTATCGQHHRPRLRIGPFAVLVATAPKGRRLGLGIGHIEQAAIQCHQSIAPIKGPCGLERAQHVGAVLKEPLQRLRSQDRSLIAHGRRPRWLLGEPILKPMRQLIPHPPLRQTTPEHHRQQKPQHAQCRKVPQAPPLLLSLGALLDAGQQQLAAIDLLQHAQVHLLAHLVSLL
jgi:hypothetical protein